MWEELCVPMASPHKGGSRICGIPCPNSVDARLVSLRLGCVHENKLPSGSFADRGRGSGSRGGAGRRVRSRQSSTVDTPTGLPMPALPAMGATGRTRRPVSVCLDPAGSALCAKAARSSFTPKRARAMPRRIEYPAEFPAAIASSVLMMPINDMIDADRGCRRSTRTGDRRSCCKIRRPRFCRRAA